MVQKFDAPSQAILKRQIAEHIAESDKPSRSPAEPGDDKPLPKDRYFDREISWLKFNKRVLEMAQDESLPLLERANFAAIFASNLDEFFMVRVAGLKRRVDTGIAVPAPSGMSPRQQLRAISEQAHKLQNEHAHYAIDTILPALAAERIVLLKWDHLTAPEQERLSRFFHRQVFPVLTPLAVDPAHPFPYISGNSLNLAVLVENPTSGKTHFARVKIPDNLPRLVAVDDLTDEEGREERYGFITMENLIIAHLESLFPGMRIKEARSFRVTRNEDIDVEEDDAENLLNAMEKELLQRRFGPPIRLEISDTASPFLSQLLASKLRVTNEEVYRLPTPLDMTVLYELQSIDRPDLKLRPFVPTTNRQIAQVESSQAQDVFASIREGDILLHHPYDSFSTSVQAFLAQAAADPQVLAIKQTLYRTSGNSPIIDALVDAAHAGKQVLALVEIKARFDEEANIAWARKLERAGVHVVYGIVGLKTHCKLSLVVRQETDGLRRYCHVGTGNYNPKTARSYTDLGLLTCDPVVGQDLTRLFNQLSGYAPKSSFHRLLVGPPHRAHRADRPHPARGAGRARRPRGVDQNQSQLHCGRADDRRPLPGQPGRGQGGHRGAGHLLPETRGARPEREHPRALHPGTFPGALPRLRLRQLPGSANRRGPHIRPGGMDWLGRPDAPEPGPASRGPGAHHRPRRGGFADQVPRPANGRHDRVLAYAGGRHLRAALARRPRAAAG
ncbi:polyphosphate kinase [Bifidobacterium actinocoloniiforme DSM 22766]|uniref:Polyphosphate kinase n=1 Tax=Bifidobacterium actinocoloniiforme DSM 22766 TaxID=1437605 RepID=A0A086Z2C3_9BIFI|nr:polyphosphate kinase [Bifidobacterium actinocoloniiforme DSM 22766]